MLTSPVKACLFLALVAQFVTAIPFPPPTGSYNTTLLISELTDDARLDPFAPTKQPRRLMISVFHPISPAECSPYLTLDLNPITAAFEDAALAQFGVQPGTFESLDLQVCHSRANPHHLSTSRNYPLVLFSPGLAGTRLFYNAIAQQLASRGYTVVTIDHAYDASIVTFPDNSTILAANITTEAQILLDLDARVKDVSFVLDKLSEPSTTARIIPSLACRLDVSNTGIIGHSLGGATAATAMLRDSRFIAGINLDGSFWGDVIQKGLDKPFLMLAHEGKIDPTWEAIWPNLTGWKRELMLAGSAHNTFTDLPDVVDVLGIRRSLPPEATDLLGTIGGARGFEVITTYVEAFFDFVMKGESSALLDKPSKSFPEVSFESP
ncbi:PAF acetylhydrolase family protein [Hyaloscypha bicolor E]|uniref:1-alkyl-2-acetylglycerophosphocholine esterase n=1 Tax=Hyaloscypha bicolor E TaxID=1095630 RepID=A0A2J6TE78_9HELO|nr:PAF acetylhydrolase family protein [Hyaloscypha bicolor E]PMD61331.1 PAF acetylhydrolase family protein [Hyaloscypha bicolor E]